MNSFRVGPSWRLCLRHEWAGWMLDSDPCPGCQAEPVAPPAFDWRTYYGIHRTSLVTKIDALTGTIVLDSRN